MGNKMKMTLRPSPTALLNPRCDPSFKALFTQETKESNTALADFISAMLDRNVSHVELLPNEPSVDSLDEMQMAFDVAVTFDDGERASIEMQGRNEDYEWASRAEIQCARLLNVAAKKGNKWHASKVYQMSVLNFNLAENDSNAFSWYNMREKGGKRELSGLLNVLFLELPKLRKLYGTPPEKLSKREKWGLFLSYADKDDAQEYITSLMQKEDGLMNAKSALNTISEDERNWWIQNSIDIARRDRETALWNAEKRGLTKGLAQGERNKAIETARILKQSGVDLALIEKSTGLSAQEIEAL